MHATSSGSRVVSLEERDRDGVRPFVDVDVIEDVAGLDAAPEEDRDARTVVVHDDVVEGMRAARPPCRASARRAARRRPDR